LAEQIQDLADVCRTGDKVEKKQVGWACKTCGRDSHYSRKEFVHSFDSSPLCHEGTPERVYEEKTVTGDMVERARLQIDARKWLLSKLKPGTYGDVVRQEISGPAGEPLKVTVEYEDKPAKS
jgi:hypothetical protein